MNTDVDYYEILQISPSAAPETVHRVYRLLAQRLHPDNADTGNEADFRLLSEAYQVISDPERRAQYDVVHSRQQQDRWRLVTNGPQTENDFDKEQILRLTVLEVLYKRRRIEPGRPGLTPLDLEALLGTAREHLEFTTWYLVQKKFATRSDSSSLVITAEGVEFLESHQREQLQRRRLNPGPEPAAA
jgi:curved DNA-binding protein CbpA